MIFLLIFYICPIGNKSHETTKTNILLRYSVYIQSQIYLIPLCQEAPKLSKNYIKHTNEPLGDKFLVFKWIY